MKSKIKKCPHCGSTSTLPIAYGLISDEGHRKNNESREWVWGGCKYGQLGTDHCKECGENFGEVVSYDIDPNNSLRQQMVKSDARVKKLLLNRKSRLQQYQNKMGNKNLQAYERFTLDFLDYSTSKLLALNFRGNVALHIVTYAIGITNNAYYWFENDYLYNGLITRNSLKIEVKSAAYLRSWKQDKLSKILFDVQPTENWVEPDKKNTKTKRQSDVYVFCLLAHKDKSTVDPLDVSQWDFYILDTKVLNDKALLQKKITLSFLLGLNPVKAGYDELASLLK